MFDYIKILLKNTNLTGRLPFTWSRFGEKRVQLSALIWLNNLIIQLIIAKIFAQFNHTLWKGQ